MPFSGFVVDALVCKSELNIVIEQIGQIRVVKDLPNGSDHSTHGLRVFFIHIFRKDGVSNASSPRHPSLGPCLQLFSFFFFFFFFLNADSVAVTSSPLVSVAQADELTQ